MKYRKKPVVIDAWKFEPGFMFYDMPDWIDQGWLAETIETVPMTDGTFRQRRGVEILLIPTLEGTMTAQLGDYIIRGIQGEVYPCKPDIFEECYEIAE